MVRVSASQVTEGTLAEQKDIVEGSDGKSSVSKAPTVTAPLSFLLGVDDSKGKKSGKSWKRMVRNKGEGNDIVHEGGDGSVGCGKRDRLGDCEMVDVESGGKKILVSSSQFGWREAVVVS